MKIWSGYHMKVTKKIRPFAEVLKGPMDEINTAFMVTIRRLKAIVAKERFYIVVLV